MIIWLIRWNIYRGVVFDLVKGVQKMAEKYAKEEKNPREAEGNKEKACFHDKEIVAEDVTLKCSQNTTAVLELRLHTDSDYTLHLSLQGTLRKTPGPPQTEFAQRAT